MLIKICLVDCKSTAIASRFWIRYPVSKEQVLVNLTRNLRFGYASLAHSLLLLLGVESNLYPVLPRSTNLINSGLSAKVRKALFIVMTKAL